MNAKAQALGLRDTRFANPDGLDAPGHYSSARDVSRLARAAMRNPVDPRDRANDGDDDLGRPTPADVERPALHVPRPAGREDGPHERRRLVAGRRCARARASSSTRRCWASRPATGRNDDLTRLLAWGISRFRADADREGRTHVCDRGAPIRQGPARARGSARPDACRSGSASRSRRRSSVRGGGRASRRQGAAARLGAGLPGGPADSLLAARRVTEPSPRRASSVASAGTRARPSTTSGVGLTRSMIA